MELLIFGHSGKPILFFPTRMARFFDYENWGIIDALKGRIENGELQIFCVDSVDAESFYNHWVHPSVRISRHIQYEHYIVNEVLPLMRSKNKSSSFEVAGCSMGAYHAINLALKHPLLFKKVVCMSGRYDLTQQLQNFKDLFDGYRDQTIYFNTPLAFMKNMPEGYDLDVIRKINIILVIGETDPFIENNQEFNQVLWAKGVVNELYTWSGYAHKPRYWRQMVRLYF